MDIGSFLPNHLRDDVFLFSRAVMETHDQLADLQRVFGDQAGDVLRQVSGGVFGEQTFVPTRDAIVAALQHEAYREYYDDLPPGSCAPAVIDIYRASNTLPDSDLEEREAYRLAQMGEWFDRLDEESRQELIDQQMVGRSREIIRYCVQEFVDRLRSVVRNPGQFLLRVS